MLGTDVFLFTATNRAMSSIWAGPILRNPSEKQKLKLRAKQVRVFHWRHMRLVKYLCRWKLWASRRSKTEPDVSVPDVLYS